MKKFVFMLAFLFAAMQVFAQSTVTGTVSDTEGTPLPGVNVWVKGYSNVGTITDVNGTFSISVPQGANTLGFSFIGMKTKEVAINNQTVINVTLENEDQTIDDVVVTALGIKRSKKALGYAVQDISGEEISQAKETNIVNSLSGKIAGVQVMGATGNIGGSSRILIRGANTIATNNQPLFVVDGMPVDNSNYGSYTQAYGNGNSDLNSGRDYGNAAQDINPDDIESITVLKGPNAAALYGSRGANGVILITTKKGNMSKGLGVNFSTGITLGQAYVFPDLQNKYGGGRNSTDFTVGTDGIDQANVTTDESWGPILDGHDVRQWGGPNNEGIVRPWVAHPNNYKDFFQLGLTFDNNLAITGASENTTYRLSYTRSDQKGTIPKSSLNRNNFNLNLDHRIGKKFNVGASISYINTKGRGRPSTGAGSDNIVYNMVIWTQRQLDLERLKDYKYPDGSQRTWRTSGFGQTNVRANNPYWIVNEDYQNDERNRIIGNITFDWDIIDGLKLKGRLGQDWYADRRQDRRAVGSRYTPYYLSDQIEFRELNGDLILNYSKNFADFFSLTANFGGSYYKILRMRNTQQTSGGLAVAEVYSIENSIDRPLIRDEKSEKIVQGIFASMSLGYKSYLFIDLSARNDWSSTLPAPYSYFYPSVGASFIFSELLQTNNILSFGKLRLSWAQAGNDTDPYRLQQTYQLETPVGSNPVFSNSLSLNNANLRPEITSSSEIGIDMNFFQNRVGLNATFYKSTTIDQIFAINVSRTTGYATKWVNAGEVENKGVELTFQGGIFRSKDGFNWDININWSRNINKIVELIEGVDSYVMAAFYTSGSSAVYLESRVGEEFSTIYATKIAKDDQGRNLINDDGTYQVTDEMQKIGSVLPDWNMGIGNNFSYKNFYLNVLFDFQKGGTLFGRGYQTALYAGTLAETAEGNIREEGIVLDGVYGPGTTNPGSTNTTILDAQSYFRLQRKTPGDHTVFDASYIKLREVSFGYSFPVKKLSKTPFKKLTLSFVGRNLAILMKNTPSGLDPESAGNSSGNIQGREYGQLPSIRNFGFKLLLNF